MSLTRQRRLFHYHLIPITPQLKTVNHTAPDRKKGLYLRQLPVQPSILKRAVIFVYVGL